MQQFKLSSPKTTVSSYNVGTSWGVSPADKLGADLDVE
jgi:hypothetical protein